MKHALIVIKGCVLTSALYIRTALLKIKHTSDQMCGPQCQPPHHHHQLIHATDEVFPAAIFGSSNNPTGDKEVCWGDLPGGAQGDGSQGCHPLSVGPKRKPPYVNKQNKIK